MSSPTSTACTTESAAAAAGDVCLPLFYIFLASRYLGLFVSWLYPEAVQRKNIYTPASKATPVQVIIDGQDQSGRSRRHRRSRTAFHRGITKPSVVRDYQHSSLREECRQKVQGSSQVAPRERASRRRSRDDSSEREPERGRCGHSLLGASGGRGQDSRAGIRSRRFCRC
ncbi:Uncharacterised protein [uncultured archaeon]|nr:Uncharacterised protein [uncultured archaeon]